MKKEKELFYFRTAPHCLTVITAETYEQAQEKATKKNKKAELVARQPLKN